MGYDANQNYLLTINIFALLTQPTYLQVINFVFQKSSTVVEELPHDFLEKNYKPSSQNIALMGISAGGAVAVSSAAYDNRIQGLITISAFADLNNTIKKQVPWLPSFWRNRAITRAEEIAKFNIVEISPINQIAKVNFPILIVHGTEDRYIPFVNGKKLYNSAKGEKSFYAVEGGNHSTVLDKGGEELQEKIVEFVRDNFL